MPEAMQMCKHRSSRSIAGRRARAMTVPALLALIAACTGGDSVTQPVNRTDTMPWALDLNYDAITMAVGEVVQLQATPLKVDGTPLTGIAAPIYTTSDTSVKVNATGQLTASLPRPSVSVFARIHNLEGNWTVADTVRVMVVTQPFDFETFDMRLSHPPVVPANDANDIDARRFRFDAKLYDALGNVVRGTAGDTIRPMTFYAASVPKNVYDISTPWSPFGFARNIGDVTVRGTAHIFGADYEDEVAFRITYPDSAVLNVYRVSTILNPSPSMMSQTDLTILRGGKVGFRSLNPTDTVGIVFADTVGVIGGNIPAVPNSPTIRIVTFPNLGQFTYTSSKGFGGTITIVDP
jgi:hypothetical protein